MGQNGLMAKIRKLSREADWSIPIDSQRSVWKVLEKSGAIMQRVGVERHEIHRKP